MPLKMIAADRLVNPASLDASDIMVTARKKLTEVELKMIKVCISDFVKAKGMSKNTYLIFAMLFGEKTIQIDRSESDFCWECAIKSFGDTEWAKKFLGVMVMMSVAKDSAKWIFVPDPEKRMKLEDLQIPLATQYFVDNESDYYKNVKVGIKTRPPTGDELEALVKKFNKR